MAPSSFTDADPRIREDEARSVIVEPAAKIERRRFIVEARAIDSIVQPAVELIEAFDGVMCDTNIRSGCGRSLTRGKVKTVDWQRVGHRRSFEINVEATIKM